MEVPEFAAQFKISNWEVLHIQPKFDLPQLWVHVEGVPHTPRHFHGIWAIGSLMGTTVDVDLPTLYSQNVVWILVAMMSPDTLNKHQDERGSYVDVTVTLKLHGYHFRFRKQKASFQPDARYSPFIWRRKDDDIKEEDHNEAAGKDPNLAQHMASSSQVSNMDIDASHFGAGGGGHGKGPAAGISSAGYHGTVLERRRAAGPSRGRPIMLGRTRPGVALVGSMAGQQARR
jgi:hypothetical protein